MERVKVENEIRKISKSKFLLNIEHKFSTPSNIYFVMEFKEGGTLL